MTREEITEILASREHRRSLADFRAARASIDVTAGDAALEAAKVEHRATLLAGDRVKARMALDKAQFLHDQDRALADELDSIIARSEVENAAFEKATPAIRELQRQGVVNGAGIHETAKLLAHLISEHLEIDRRLRLHNATAAVLARGDLRLKHPWELLSEHVGVSAGLLPKPEDWEFDYWPDKPRPGDGRTRLEGFGDLLSESAKPRKAAA